MPLTRLSVERYKCFEQRQEIEVRPLTMLIGRNSSGKSALARLPLLLRHALSGRAVAPLDVSVDGVEFGGSFVDLVHGRFAHGSVGLGFRIEIDDGRAWDWTFEVQNIDEQKLQLLKRLDIVEDGSEELHVEWVGTEDLSRPVYEVHDGGKPRRGVTDVVEFRGLVPPAIHDVVDSETNSKFLVWPHFAKEELEPIRYLGPFRKIPKREHGYPGGRLQDVGPGGALAPEVLGGDAARQEQKLLGAVGDFYERYLGGGRLDVEGRGERFSLVIRSPGGSDTAINLVDAGAGLSQALPLVVQRYLDAESGKGGGIEIVEQPELHLHPAAHAALADLYVEAVTARPRPRFIIETHSENFILRVRRRIAEGKISTDDVALYWVDDASERGSCVRRVEIDERGEIEPDTWPRGVFSEDFEEVKAIRRAQRGRSL